MNKSLILLLSFVFLYSCNNESKSDAANGPVTSTPASQHSNDYNSRVDAVLDDYEALTGAFIRWDSAAIPSLVQNLQSKMESLQADSVGNREKAAAELDSARRQLAGIAGGSNLEARRYALDRFSRNFYAFLQASQFDAQPLYLQLCPMAFNDVEEGIWISRGDSVRNPYLGLYHPRYGKGMLECGEVKEVLNRPASQLP